ncbi:MAG: hypothetical protein GEV12_12155 [Micromonosporaceae bacterium]|nr:hypothetical protein [Micromonosporaceae bacterium]
MSAPLWSPHISSLPTTVKAGCTPGAEGMPGRLLGRILCGDYPLSAWGHTLAGRWPLLLAVVLAAVAARLAVTVLRRRRWSRQAAQARWLEITPPVTASPATTVALWRLLATLLPAARWWRKHPTARLVWEVAATGDQLRCGLWVPPGVSATAVIRVLQRAWPGAHAEHAPPPELPPDRPVAAHQLRAAAPEWLPLIDDPPPVTTGRRDTATEEDRLRAVYDGLAAAGRTGGGLLQVHLLRAPRGRVAALRRATVDPTRARRTGRGQAAGLVLAAVTAVVRGLLDLLTPGKSSTQHANSRRVDPYAAQQAQQARAKYGQPPHLLAAVYAAGVGPTKAAARAAAEDISSGYGLISAHLTRRRLYRPCAVLNQRRTTPAAMILVSVVEAAALAGLPAEPAAYGLPAAASRRRGPGRDTWAAPATGGHRPPPPTHPVPDADVVFEDGPEPSLWSIP